MSAISVTASDVRAAIPPDLTSAASSSRAPPSGGLNVPVNNTPPAAASGQSGVPAGEFFRQAAVALNLPVDTLSVTLLAISRFLSLPLKQALIETLRKDVLASSRTLPVASSPQTAAEKTALEAKAMAAAAAFDKGLALSGEALERYARFFVPPISSEESERHHEDTAEKNPREGKEANTGGGDRKNSRNREEVPEKEELRAIAEKEATEDNFLDFFNSAPGRNGQYWKVFPFNIIIRGTELKVFIRTLKGEPLFSGGNEYIIVDIASPKRQYRFFVKTTNGKIRTSLQVYPELSAKALKSLSKKAANFLNIEEISARSGGEPPSWAEDWNVEHLPSINEEV